MKNVRISHNFKVIVTRMRNVKPLNTKKTLWFKYFRT